MATAAPSGCSIAWLPRPTEGLNHPLPVVNAARNLCAARCESRCMAMVVRAAPVPGTAEGARSTRTYVCQFVRHPRRTWLELLADPARLRHGFLAVLCVGLGYALTAGGIAASEGTPSTPWLAIPPGDYFTWEALFVTPVTVLCWVLAGGTVHLVSKLCAGRGSFEDTLALLGFAVALPT